ncbi:nuclease-related domain-containing DEAD/DEAH box helicase [Brachybacterium sp. J153]|uniref:nuclease-related domain-containing DEAD/DEAH box helicase n=1 Tax=Brachybacterium sp. J153 TaxID=3116488 RepID=UPI002E7A1AD5|nr:NERD domain-containing protein [Brachybacterium sp. J153]MEE1617229.1 NERD domain-containing protein [Brachybacterium sp. J153]
MPILLPENPEFASAAERAVWRELVDQLPPSAAILAGQRITEGGEEVEADLVVLWPGMGLAVIEVKGGTVSVVDGEWRQADRSGSHLLLRSPLDQAQRAKHAILRYLDGATSRPVGRAVHLAALPYTELPVGWRVPEAPRRLIIDGTDLPRIAERIVAALNTEARQGHGPLDELQRDVLVKRLRTTQHAIRNQQLLADALEDESNELTREQERAISLLRFQHRAQIVGGAGSGKTHLAMIKARTLAREGFRTALLCYSRGLARHFELQAATWPAEERPAYVGLFHDLPVRWGAEDFEAFDGPPTVYYEEHLPARLAEVAAAQSADELFDAIVVDEAQDFSDTWWDALLPCLRDPEAGVLFVFTDEHQTVFDREGRAPITLNPFPLDENLRNTRAIARSFAPLTALEQRPRLDEGLPVRFIPSTAEEAVSAADDLVEELLDEGWAPGDIALITTLHRHPEQVARIEAGGYDVYWDEFFAGDDVFYGHVLNIKGLERRVVILAVNGFRTDERAAQLLYVGLSRARSLLVVVADPGDIWDAGGAEVWEQLGGSA